MSESTQRNFLMVFIAFLLAFVIWQYQPVSFLVYPVRLFVTFVHELGHGVAILMTGGEFVRFELKSTGAGLAYSRGGIREIIIPAGYVGTALFGSVLLYATNRMKRPEWIAVMLGVGLSALTLLYTGISLSNLDHFERFIALGTLILSAGYFLITPTDRGRFAAIGVFLIGLLMFVYWGAGENTLTVIVGVFSGVALIFIGYLGVIGYHTVTVFTLNFLAFAVGLNAITDSWFLLRLVSFNSRLVHNDATAMADQVGMSAPFWAFLWILAALLMFSFSAWVTFFRPVTRELEFN